MTMKNMFKVGHTWKNLRKNEHMDDVTIVHVFKKIIDRELEDKQWKAHRYADSRNKSCIFFC